MQLSLAEILKATGGELISKKLSTQKINNISIDSRSIEKNDLFIAIKGIRYDAHQFIPEVINKGAIGCIVERVDPSISNEALLTKTFIKVKDTKVALQNIAKYYRKKFDTKVIGITGSVGKTTTKEMLYNLLSSKYKVLKTRANYNNEIGIPLTIFELKKEHQFATFEMGTRNIGDIKLLTEIALPSMGIITTIGKAHIGRFNSLKNIFYAETELIEGIEKNGIVILNKDNKYLKNLKTDKRVVYFGINTEAEFSAENIRIIKDTGFEFDLKLNNERIACFLPSLGMSNIYNILAAATCAYILGVDVEDIKKEIKNTEAPQGRLTLIKTKKIKIIDDTYNANPDSTSQALWVLKHQIEGKRKIAVLADMLELGKRASYEHRKIGKLISSYKLDYLITVGKLARYIAETAKLNKINTFIAKDKKEVINKLKKILKEGDVVLVKGSRATKMEEVVQELL